jgi:hypothetical protein
MRVVCFSSTYFDTFMKKALAAALFTTFLFAGAMSASAQTTAKAHTKVKSKTTTTHSSATSKMSRTSSDTDADMSADNPVHSENPGDPLYLNHPYFNGEARWTDVDSLYKHGDFPWALVSKNPENFRFDAASGSWQTNAPNLGKTNSTR